MILKAKTSLDHSTTRLVELAADIFEKKKKNPIHGPTPYNQRVIKLKKLPCCSSYSGGKGLRVGFLNDHPHNKYKLDRITLEKYAKRRPLREGTVH